MFATPSRPKWKGTMTDRERFNNQMHYKPVDRCFNMEFGYWEENFTSGIFSSKTASPTTAKPTCSSTSTESKVSSGNTG